MKNIKNAWTQAKQRECVTLAIKMAEEAGYRDVKEVLAAGKPLVCGDKVYANYMGKALALLRMAKSRSPQA